MFTFASEVSKSPESAPTIAINQSQILYSLSRRVSSTTGGSLISIRAITVDSTGSGFPADESYRCLFGFTSVPGLLIRAPSKSGLQEAYLECRVPRVPAAASVSLSVVNSQDTILYNSNSTINNNVLFQYLPQPKIERIRRFSVGDVGESEKECQSPNKSII